MNVKRLIAGGLVAAVAAAFVKKVMLHRRAEWEGLTESEARSKLDEKLPGKIPAEKRSAISDVVVGKMRDRGVLVDDAAVPTT